MTERVQHYCPEGHAYIGSPSLLTCPICKVREAKEAQRRKVKKQNTQTQPMQCRKCHTATTHEYLGTYSQVNHWKCRECGTWRRQ